MVNGQKNCLILFVFSFTSIENRIYLSQTLNKNDKSYKLYESKSNAIALLINMIRSSLYY